MTETKWLEGSDPRDLLLMTRDVATDRKLRLFACACCCHAWNRFVPPLVVDTVALAEAFADGTVNADELAHASQIVSAAAEEAQAAAPNGSGYVAHVLRAAVYACAPQSWPAADNASMFAARAGADLPVSGASQGPEAQVAYRNERAEQPDLLRDILGNPFRKVAFDTAWRTLDAVALANAMYESHEFGAMPILADALQEAGCDSEDILNHCREEREHVRGCWVVDLLLGKE